jgi:tetratricopeptide (TPR) repeat protein
MSRIGSALPLRARWRGALALALLGAAVLAFACSSQQSRLAEHMKQGDEYREQQRWDAAILEYRNALQIDPNDADAHWGLARAYLSARKVREGYWELRETARLAPQNLEARLRFGQLSLLAGELDEAVTQAQAIVQADPKNVEAHLLLGRAREGLKDLDGAKASYEAALEADPDSAAALLVLGTFRQRQGQPEQAEPLLVKLTQVEPGALSYTALGRFYAAEKRDDDAEAAFEHAVEVAKPEERAGAYRGLAGYYYGRERFPEAEKTLRDGIDQADEGKLDLIYLLAQLYRAQGDTGKADAMIEEATRAKPDDPRPFLILSSYRGRQNDLEGALEAADAALKIDPSNLRARLRKAEVLVDLGFRQKDKDRIAAGRAIVEAALAQEPSNPEALFVKGKLELADRKIDDAITVMRQAIDARPDWAQAHFVLGSALVLKGDLTTARAELARALELDPSLIETRRLLAQVHADLGEHEYAVGEGTRYLRERPDDTKAQILVAQSLVRLGKGKEARARLEAIPEDKRDAETWYALARLASSERRFDDAWALLLRADALEPHHPNVLRTMLGVERARTGKVDESAARVNEALKEKPDDPKLVQLGATLALVQGDAAKAEVGYKRAIELDPSDAGAYQELARFYILTGRRKETIETYEKALAGQPKSAKLHHLLGVLYESDGQPDKAIEHYEAAVRLDPNTAEAKNNLAYLLAERGEQLDRALDLAQEAKALLPDNANAADTLGWVLFKRGVPSAAIGYLREAEAAMDPNDMSIGIVRHHLAQAYEANGQVDQAVTSLDRALADLDKQLAAVRASGHEPHEPEWAADLRAMRDRLASSS